jgi:hypothetical protein
MPEEFPKQLKRGDDSRRNWNQINELTQLAKNLTWKLDDALRRVTRLEAEGDLWQTGGGGAIQRYKIITDNDDYLVCQAQNADATLVAGNINIAKPRSLRVSTWNGATIGKWSYTGTKTERTLTYAGPAIDGGLQPGDTMKEILDPPYDPALASASELCATTAIGATAVIVSGVLLTLIDLNADARRWVAQRDRVEACKVIAGVPTVRKLVIEGGPSFA